VSQKQRFQVGECGLRSRWAQNELSAASKLSVASGDAGIVVPAVDFVDRLDGLAFAGASGASGASIQEPPHSSTRARRHWRP
jgi:hypothetical protein